ncbi:hypothetical protein [Sphingomonas desiccabilis]|uniref:Envelope stress response membrane protein PspB n=1 Tax=Sphingomonas desiccabilis TaxID=429134 RepID=A0A4V1QPP9_9SPHN|nr:hypothetical protein [Sphingomonas desiccabilis]MBB3909882.1 hypothetical protein [Sphingomonas desiccabilis]RXZ34557.1 hypothetical protein EO081_02420 [Sphingomonas desiccabilis]
MSPILIPILALMIPIVAIVGKTFVKPWLDHRERALELEANKLAEKAAQYAAQTERLEQRVRVLERIVTDRGLDLSDEIERLRDQPPLN